MLNDAAGSFVTGARTGAESTGATVTAFSGQTTLTGTYGQLIIHTDGSYQYNLIEADPQTNALAAGQVVHEFFTYGISVSSVVDTAQIDIAITGANDAPVITTFDFGFAQPENSTAVLGTIVATDADSNPLNYTVTGADGSLFQISNTGALRFKVAADFDAPRDANDDGVYQITVQVSDGTATSSRDYAIIVQDVDGNTINGTKKGNLIDDSHGIKGKFATGEEDVIDGRAGNDTIKAGGGDDLVRGGAGKDSLDGGTGIDGIDYGEKQDSVSLNLAKLKKGMVSVTVDGKIEDTIKGFENAAGGTGNDSLSGDKRANMLIGNAGDDFLSGDKGADILFGGLGKDTLKGGAGGDQFLFFEPVTKGNLDTLSDFKHGEDKFVLDHTTIFTAIGATLEAGEFVSRSSTKALKAK